MYFNYDNYYTFPLNLHEIILTIAFFNIFFFTIPITRDLYSNIIYKYEYYRYVYRKIKNYPKTYEHKERDAIPLSTICNDVNMYINHILKRIHINLCAHTYSVVRGFLKTIEGVEIYHTQCSKKKKKK